MEVCNAIAKRATCDRGRSGCVIAKDNQILVTGYVGAPSGLPHCDEVGHQFKKVIHEDGSVTQQLCQNCPCGTERNLPGCQTGCRHRRWDPLLPNDTVQNLRDDDY